jgi:hypothetical protein
MVKTPAKQNRSGTRAPHRAPEYTDRISFYCTARQKVLFNKNKGSIWMRHLLDRELRKGKGK